MKNHCAYCHGKFGLVRHQRAFKEFLLPEMPRSVQGLAAHRSR